MVPGAVDVTARGTAAQKRGERRIGARRLSPREAGASRKAAARAAGAAPRRAKERMKRAQYPGRSPGSPPIRGSRAAAWGESSGGVKAV
jgi:hypothetical protein